MSRNWSFTNEEANCFTITKSVSDSSQNSMDVSQDSINLQNQVISKGVVEKFDEMHTIGDPRTNDSSHTKLSEERFRQVYFYDSPPQHSLASHLKSIKCSSRQLLKLIPILQWLPKYNIKHLGDDIISGFTVAVMHIPQGMAYALLGGVPPIVGIYMAFFPVLVYIILGTSRHISMGTFAVVCMMVGKSVDFYSHTPEGNLTEDGQQNFKPPTPTEVASAVCLIVGIWQVILSVLKLGSLSVLLSQTLVSGFTTGAAVHVLTSQIKNLLGIKVKRYSGPFKIVFTYIDIFENISNLNTTATILSLSFIIALFICNELIKPYLQKLFKKAVPIPFELLAVIAGTLLSQFLDLKDKFGLAVVDSIPTGLPQPSVPPLYLLSGIITDGLVIAIVALSINISMASIFAQKLGYEIDANQEILASGVGNVFSAFFSCMPFATSLSRSLIQQTVGGKTQIASVVSCLSLLLVLLFIGPFFEPLPYCVLSTIIVVALKGMFKQMWEVPVIYRNSKLDAMVWMATFLGVVLLDIDYGLGIGVIASVSTLLIRSQNTEVVALGVIPNTQIYVDVDRFKKSQIPPKTLVLQIIGGIHFANVSAVRKKIMKLFSKLSKNLSLGLVNPEKHTKHLYLVFDLSCVPFLDPSAIKALKTLYEDMKVLQCSLLLSGSIPSVYDSLEKSDFFRDYPKSLIFHSVHDAVEYTEELEDRSRSEMGPELISKF